LPAIIPPGKTDTILVQIRIQDTTPIASSILLIGEPCQWQNSFAINGTISVYETTLSMPIDSGKPGDTIFLPIIVQSLNQTVLSRLSCQIHLHYNSNILLPIGIRGGYLDSLVNGEAIFTLTDVVDTPYLECIVGLGDTTATTLHIDTVIWNTCLALSHTSDGIFTLTGLCQQGGTRLFDTTGTASLSQNVPNPFSQMTRIFYRTIENGATRIWISDVLGRQQALLVDGYRNAGSYALEFNENGLPAGVYYYILQTPTQRLSRTMIVER
jgi:hypothetical protein